MESYFFERVPGGVLIFWEAPRWRVNILGGSQVVCKCFRRLPGVGLYFAIFGRVPGGVLIFWEAPRLISMSCN